MRTQKILFAALLAGLFLLGACNDLTYEEEPMPDGKAVTAIDFRGEGYPWRDHAAPYDYLFGANMDNHQQSKLSGVKNLEGFLYVVFTGEYRDGIPVAKHEPCSDNPTACTVGWNIHGVLTEATLVQKGMGRPQWYIASEDMPAQRGFTFFQHLREGDHGSGGMGGSGGSGGHEESDHTDDGGCSHDDGDTHDDGCDEGHDDGGCSHDDGDTHDDGCGGDHDDGSGGHGGGIQVGQSYTGYLMKLTAREKFWFKHKGEYFLVKPGIDSRTHDNVHN